MHTPEACPGQRHYRDVPAPEQRQCPDKDDEAGIKPSYAELMLNPKLVGVWSVSSWSTVILQRPVGQAGLILASVRGRLKLSKVLIIESCDVGTLCLTDVSDAQMLTFYNTEVKYDVLKKKTELIFA